MPASTAPDAAKLETNFAKVNEKLDRIESKLDKLRELGISVGGTAASGEEPSKSKSGARIAEPSSPTSSSPKTTPRVPAPPKDGRKPAFIEQAAGGGGDAQGPEDKPKRRGVRIADDQSPQQTDLSPPAGNAGGRRGIHFASITDGAVPAAPAGSASGSGKFGADSQKQRASAAKQRRKDFFDHLVFDGPWHQIPKSRTVQCSWLACASVAIHFVSGVETSLEDILKHNQMAMHYVTFPSVTLAELFDNVDEYVTSAPTMHDLGVRAEVATFDAATVDEVGDELGTGDRLPVMSLAAFRKELNANLVLDQNIYIFNYDPYVVQENEMRNPDDEAEEDENEESSTGSGSPKKKKLMQWQPKNMGSFALLLNFNPALHTVTLATPHFDDSTGQFHLETHMCSIQTLYSACCAKDGYTKRSRGFVRVFKAQADDHHQPVPSIFPINLLDGRSANGMLSIALDVAIAPHILGLAISHHIVAETMLPRNSARSNAALRGIPVSDLCVELQLPVHIVTGGSAKTPLPTVFALYHEFLQRRGVLQSGVHVGVVPVTRKGGADDGMPSVLDEDFFAHLVASVASKSVLLVNFDVNVAQNVVIVDPSVGDPSHFAIVVGIDEHRGIVRLADVSVKKFRKTWHVPLVRLYNAIIGYGYVIISQDAAVANRFDPDGSKTQRILSSARNRLPPQLRLKSMFEFPRKNYNVTVLASVLTQMGFPTTVEDIVFNSGFHISFLLSEHIPLRDVCRILVNYVHAKLGDQVRVTPQNFDKGVVSLETFAARVQESCRDDSTFLLVNYNTVALQGKDDVWNGSVGGPLAVVVAFDPTTRIVTLSDTNPEAFYRTWACPIDFLHAICHDIDKISSRARGWILVEKAAARSPPVIDMRNAMVHHPFKPPVSSRASAIALAVSQLIGLPQALEDVIYSNATFSLRNLSLGTDIDKTLEMSAQFVAARQLAGRISLVCVPSSELRKGCPDTNTTIWMVLYKQSLLIESENGVGGALLSAIDLAAGEAEFVDGNQTKFGTWRAPLSSLIDGGAIVGVLAFTKI